MGGAKLTSKYFIAQGELLACDHHSWSQRAGQLLKTPLFSGPWEVWGGGKGEGFMIYLAFIHLNSAFVHHLLEHVCCRDPWQALDALHSLDLSKTPLTLRVSSARVSGRGACKWAGGGGDSLISTFENTWGT